MPCSFTVLVQLANKYSYEDYELREALKSIRDDLSLAYNTASDQLLKQLTQNFQQAECPTFLALLLNYIHYGADRKKREYLESREYCGNGICKNKLMQLE